MGKFIQKQREITAVKYDGSILCLSEAFGIIGIKGFKAGEDNDILVPTDEDTWMKCSIGDYVIRRPRGNFYVCKKEVFEVMYEEVIT